MSFLSEIPPFSKFELGLLGDVVRTQLQHGQHLAAMKGEVMVGYAGWLKTSAQEASEWIEGRAILTARFDSEADSAALTIFAVLDSSITQRLIRGARSLNVGMKVFFKRGANWNSPIPRKGSVLNFTPVAS